MNMVMYQMTPDHILAFSSTVKLVISPSNPSKLQAEVSSSVTDWLPSILLAMVTRIYYIWLKSCSAALPPRMSDLRQTGATFCGGSNSFSVTVVTEEDAAISLKINKCRCYHTFSYLKLAKISLFLVHVNIQSEPMICSCILIKVSGNMHKHHWGSSTLS